MLAIDRRKHRSLKYSERAREKLLWLWQLMSMPCGKYMAIALPQWLASLEAHGELVQGSHGWTQTVRDELLAMSPATIDRYLKPKREQMRFRKGLSSTKAGPLLRNSIKVRRAGDEMEQEPGFFEVDTVAHCGPTLRGDFVRTITMTDVYTGWVHLEAIRNNARVHVLGGLAHALGTIPYHVQGLDCDNGSEFINHDVASWLSDIQVFFTRSRPYRKNDQAHVESKNNHVVRRYGYYYRYDTEEERSCLARLWQLVTLKMNLFTPTKKPIGWSKDQLGRRKRLYDTPTTPMERLLAAGVLSIDQIQQLKELHASINPATLARDILSCQATLIALAKDKTELATANVARAQENRQRRLSGGVRLSS